MTSTIRAKFECTGAEEAVYGTGTAVTVTMQAVYGDGSDNAAWSQATPSGTLTMVITNPAALGAFTVGMAYYLDLTPVQAPAAAAQPADPDALPPDADLGTIPGVTVVATEAEVAQEGGPAQAWAALAAASPAPVAPASSTVIPPTPDAQASADPTPAAPVDAPPDPAPAPAPDAQQQPAPAAN